MESLVGKISWQTASLIYLKMKLKVAMQRPVINCLRFTSVHSLNISFNNLLKFSSPTGVQIFPII